MVMNATIHTLRMGLALCMAMLYHGNASAQIDYYQDFTDDGHRWTTLDFYTTDVAVCGTNFAYRANPVNQAGVTVPVETVSPSLGISNGEELRLSYNYKLLDYDDVLPYRAVDDEDWGMVSIEYGPTINGPWTQVDAIMPYDHYITDECVQRTVAFTPPLDSEVFLRIVADAGTSLNTNYFVYIDDIIAFQETLTIEPLLTRDVEEVYPNPVTDFMILDYPGRITDVAVFDTMGQEVALQDMDGDYKRLNMEGLASGQYMVKIATDDAMVRTVNVLKR